MQQVVLPTEVQTRFVQVYVRDRPYLICKNEDSHAKILAETLHGLGIIPKTRFGFPNAFGDGYRLVGDGFCSNIGNEYKLMGESAHYKLGPNRKHLEDLTAFIPSGVVITIDEKVEANPIV
ncbi:hypothetical protein HYX05_02870 [Candidatus Woesearchaeota archaeon]|nr:hypothetical protein [Candidatus Woesearchaeota archaeon]